MISIKMRPTKTDTNPYKRKKKNYNFNEQKKECGVLLKDVLETMQLSVFLAGREIPGRRDMIFSFDKGKKS